MSNKKQTKTSFTTLAKTFGPNQFWDGVSSLGWSDWAGMSRCGYMDGATATYIKNFAQQFLIRYNNDLLRFFQDKERYNKNRPDIVFGDMTFCHVKDTPCFLDDLE